MQKISLSKLDQLLNYIEKILSPNKLMRYIVFLFKACVVAASLFGTVKGLQSAIQTIRKRKIIRLSNKTLQPIVNILVRVGTFLSYPIFSAVLSALVVATAPVSVPYIMLLNREQREERADDAQHMRTLN